MCHAIVHLNTLNCVSQQRCNHLFERIEREWFSQKIPSFFQWHHRGDLNAGVAADEEHRQTRFGLHQLERELIAGQPGHDDICHQQIDFRVTPKAVRGLHARSRLQYGVAAMEQVLIQKFPQILVIIHQQDRPDRI